MKLTIIDKVFVPVSVKDELPKENDYYNVIYDYTKSIKTLFFTNNEFSGAVAPISHWLKEETNKYVLSKEQIEQVISDAIQFGISKQSSFEIGGGKNVKLLDLTNEFSNSIL